MPVTQRFVHGGVCLVFAVLTISVVVIALGASRTSTSNAGLAGSTAPQFTLRTATNEWVSLESSVGKVSVVAFIGGKRDSMISPVSNLSDTVGVFESDASVSFISVIDSSDVGVALRSTLATLPQSVRVVTDIDGAVARAYRVGVNESVAFVIDEQGIIHGRVPLRDASSVIALTEAVSSLKRAEFTQPLAQSTNTSR